MLQKAYHCNKCPRACGTCELCNKAFHRARSKELADASKLASYKEELIEVEMELLNPSPERTSFLLQRRGTLRENIEMERERVSVSDSSPDELKLIGVEFACEGLDENGIFKPTTDAVTQDDAGDPLCVAKAEDCLACPVMCSNLKKGSGEFVYPGLIETCRDDFLAGVSSGAYGRSRNMVSLMTRDQHQHVAGMRAPSAVVVSPDGTHVYVASYAGNGIVCFLRNSSTGDLFFLNQGGLRAGGDAAVACETSADACGGDGYMYHGLQKMVMTRDGAYVYAVAFESGALHTLKRNRKTGALTPLGLPLIDGGEDDAGVVIDGLAGATDVFLSHDERSIFVAGTVYAPDWITL